MLVGGDDEKGDGSTGGLLQGWFLKLEVVEHRGQGRTVLAGAIFDWPKVRVIYSSFLLCSSAPVTALRPSLASPWADLPPCSRCAQAQHRSQLQPAVQRSHRWLSTNR
jgi:hypothetical protein